VNSKAYAAGYSPHPLDSRWILPLGALVLGCAATDGDDELIAGAQRFRFELAKGTEAYELSPLSR
jgi:hypothetical protein